MIRTFTLMCPVAVTAVSALWQRTGLTRRKTWHNYTYIKYGPKCPLFLIALILPSGVITTLPTTFNNTLNTAQHYGCKNSDNRHTSLTSRIFAITNHILFCNQGRNRFIYLLDFIAHIMTHIISKTDPNDNMGTSFSITAVCTGYLWVDNVKNK